MTLAAVRRLLGPALVLHLYRALIAALVALPVVRAAGRLLAPLGGDAVALGSSERTLELLDALRASTREVVVTGSFVTALAALLGLLPVALALEGLLDGERASLRSRVRRALSRMPGFVALAGVAMLLKTIGFALLGLGLRTLASHWVTSNDRTRDLVEVGGWVVACIPLVVLAVAEDAARCAMVGRRLRFYEATARGFSMLRARPFALIGRWLLRTLAVWASTAGVFWSVHAIGVGSIPRLFAAVLFAQAGLYASELVRTAWFASILDMENGLRYGPRPLQSPAGDEGAEAPPR